MQTNTRTLLSHYSRRKFLTVGGLALAGGLAAGPSLLRAAESATVGEVMPRTDAGFQPAPLPYAYDALEPSIDEATMRLHHDKHYVGYTNNLNKALAEAPDFQSLSIEELLGDLAAVPESVRKAVRNNGGGYYNHSLFWTMMTPDGSGKPDGELAAAIDESFGSFDEFKEKFTKEAATVFGSGWAWLIVTPDGKLAITSTPNQDTPIMKGVAEVEGKPVLALDVWEHAYYLKYKNVRADYLSAWWDVVNWPMAAELYAKAKG